MHVLNIILKNEWGICKSQADRASVEQESCGGDDDQTSSERVEMKRRDHWGGILGVYETRGGSGRKSRRVWLRQGKMLRLVLGG